jgi:hypothetical protein
MWTLWTIRTTICVETSRHAETHRWDAGQRTELADVEPRPQCRQRHLVMGRAQMLSAPRSTPGSRARSAPFVSHEQVEARRSRCKALVVRAKIEMLVTADDPVMALRKG